MSNKPWGNYEEVAQYLLNRFADIFELGRVEGKQIIPGEKVKKGWEIDAKGVTRDGEGFLIVKCRRYTTSRLNQEKIGGLVFRIQDTGAQGGIIVSPLGLQQGAKEIAASSNIKEVILDQNSTKSDYLIKFLEQAFVGLGLSETCTGTDTVHVQKIIDEKRG